MKCKRVSLLFCILAECLLATCASTTLSGQQPIGDPIPKQSLKQLNLVVEKYVADEFALGAELLVVQNSKVLSHKSFGLVDEEDDRTWKNNTLCNIRSMSKSITSAAAQILIDRGKLDLNQPVAHYLESFDNDESRSITVRQVLTHRSGLPLTNVLTPYRFESLAAQVDNIGEAGPQFEPGSRFWYSDIGADTVGRLVEKVSGETLDQFVEREIFAPLRMNDTLYGFDPDNAALKTAAGGYMKGANGWFRFWKAGGKPLYPFAWGSQSIYSTTTDYAKFLQLLMDGGRVGDQQILSPEAVERMLTPVSRTTLMGSERPAPTGFLDLQSWYGQMMVLYCRPDNSGVDKPPTKRVAFGHSGSDGTVAIAWPDRDLIILYYTQTRGGISAMQIERAIDRLIIRPDQQVTTDGVPEKFHPYVGHYLKPEGEGTEQVSIVYSNGSLILDIPSELPFELLPPNDEGFWQFSIAPDKLKLKFEHDESGKVSGITLHRGSKVVRAEKVD